MSTDEAAELAIRDKSPRLDGRRCNVNLAYIGQKKKNIGITGRFILKTGLLKISFRYQPLAFVNVLPLSNGEF